MFSDYYKVIEKCISIFTWVHSLLPTRQEDNMYFLESLVEENIIYKTIICPQKVEKTNNMFTMQVHLKN